LEIREERAWLLRSRINPVPIPGVLSLTDGRIRFELDPEADPQSLDWLERQLGVQGIAEKLERGESVFAFDHPLSECAVSWPLTGGGAMMVVRAPTGRKWVISGEEPSGGKVPRPRTTRPGQRRARDWKRALADAGA
jgi:hypothetical protein